MNNIKLFIKDTFYDINNSFKFSGGEIQVRLPENLPDGINQYGVHIYCKLLSSDDIMELLLLVDALDRKYPNKLFSLEIGYLPYARQDRVCYPGEAFSLEVFARLINSCGFSKVYVHDAHSTVALELINNVEEIEQWSIFYDMIQEYDIPIQDMILVSPDKGALIKINKIESIFGINAINAYKVRDPNTGNIIETKIDIEDFNGTDIMIVDDICDGGQTFIELAKVLKTKNCGKLNLYVTHGIFSKGTSILYDYFDCIYTTDSIFDEFDLRVKVIDLFSHKEY